MTEQQFQSWLDQVYYLWVNKKPELAPNICAENFLWYEAPFRQPYTTKEEIIKEWQGLRDFKDIKVSFEILCVTEKYGIAKWNSESTQISTGKIFIYEGIYQVSLDDNGKCTEFREWFNLKP